MSITIRVVVSSLCQPFYMDFAPLLGLSMKTTSSGDGNIYAARVHADRADLEVWFLAVHDPGHCHPQRRWVWKTLTDSEPSKHSIGKLKHGTCCLLLMKKCRHDHDHLQGQGEAVSASRQLQAERDLCHGRLLRHLPRRHDRHLLLGHAQHRLLHGKKLGTSY